jgi:hypothetical protein
MRSVNASRCCLVLSAAFRLGLSRRPQHGPQVEVSNPEPTKATHTVVDGLLIVVVRRLEEKCMYQRRGRGVITALVVVSALLIPVVSAGAQTSADNTLSTYAHNVKIVAQNGQVTLK